MRAFRIAEDVPGMRLVLVATDRRAWQFDRARGVIIAGGGWLDWRAEIPLARIDHVRLSFPTAADGIDLPLTLAIRYRVAAATPMEISEPLRIADLDRQHELRDLAFRIAQI